MQEENLLTMGLGKHCCKRDQLARFCKPLTPARIRKYCSWIPGFMINTFISQLYGVRDARELSQDIVNQSFNFLKINR